MLEDTHMTKMKKILAVALCILLLGSVFAAARKKQNRPRKLQTKPC